MMRTLISGEIIPVYVHSIHVLKKLNPYNTLMTEGYPESTE